MSENSQEASNFFNMLFESKDNGKEVMDDVGLGNEPGRKKMIDKLARLGGLSSKLATAYQTTNRIGTIDWYKELAQKAGVDLDSYIKPRWWTDEEEKRGRQ